MSVVLLTPGAQPAGLAFPALALVDDEVRSAEVTASAALQSLAADVLVVDARTDLVGARSVCVTLSATAAAPPVLLVLSPGGLPVVTTAWGASDILVDGASPAEIQARLRLLREHSAPVEESTVEVIEAGDLHIDTAAYSVRVRGRTLDLTFREFELLKHLASHPGRVFARTQLLQDVWGYDYFGGTRTVDVHVRRLRAKLGPEHDHMVATVRNVGYRFEAARRRRAPEAEVP